MPVHASARLLTVVLPRTVSQSLKCLPPGRHTARKLEIDGALRLARAQDHLIARHQCVAIALAVVIRGVLVLRVKIQHWSMAALRDHQGLLKLGSAQRRPNRRLLFRGHDLIR